MKFLLLSVLLFSAPAFAVEEVSTKQFTKIVDNSEIPVILDVYATWCGPCKFLAPMLEKAESKYKGKIKIVKMDYEKNKEIGEKVRAFPTLLILTKKGHKLKVQLREGAFESQKDLEKFLDEVLKTK